MSLELIGLYRASLAQYRNMGHCDPEWMCGQPSTSPKAPDPNGSVLDTPVFMDGPNSHSDRQHTVPCGRFPYDGMPIAGLSPEILNRSTPSYLVARAEVQIGFTARRT